MIASGCVWPVLLNTVEGVRAVDPVMAETARSYGITGAARLRHLVLRSASPQIFAGLRQALSIGIILMVISEMFAASNGLGFTIVQFQRSFAIPDMWTGILVLGLLGFLLSVRLPAGRAAGARPGTTVCAPPPGGPGEPRERAAGMLDVRGLKKVYEGSGRRVEAVRDLTFTVDAGELVCLVGPSGCGKTTLLKCMGGLLDADRRRSPPGGTDGDRAAARDGRSCSRSTAAACSPGCGSRDNVELPLKQKDLSKARRRELVADALRVGRASRTPPARTPGSCPAVCSSGSPSPGRWRTSPRCC